MFCQIINTHSENTWIHRVLLGLPSWAKQPSSSLPPELITSETETRLQHPRSCCGNPTLVNNYHQTASYLALVDATKNSWVSTSTQPQTNRLRLRVQVQLFKAAHNIINIAHVSGTKEASTLTRTQIPATQQWKKT